MSIASISSVPEWFSAITALGLAAASQPNTDVGNTYPVTLLSAPTGQFVAWALLNGAVHAAPKIISPSQFPSTCVGWNKDSNQVDDQEASQVKYEGGIALKIGGWTYTNSVPLVQLPEGVEPRTGRVLMANERKLIKSKFEKIGIATSSRPWYLPWTEQCLSPIVIVGDGVEHLLDQLAELNDDPRARNWMSPLATTLTSVSSGKVSEPDHILRLPFSVLSQRATSQYRWIDQLKPRLVVYTRWSYFRRRPASVFSGVPTVVIANRRVEASVDASNETQNIRRPLPGWLSSLRLPRGLSCRYLEYATLGPRSIDAADDYLDEDDF